MFHYQQLRLTRKYLLVPITHIHTYKYIYMHIQFKYKLYLYIVFFVQCIYTIYCMMYIMYKIIFESTIFNQLFSYTKILLNIL